MKDALPDRHAGSSRLGVLKQGSRCRKQWARGFTLIELILFIVIVGVGVAGVLSVLNINAAHSGDPFVRKQALAIAESLLEEILAHDFSDPDGVEPEGSRALFDDVDDYDGFAMSGIEDISGAAIAGLGSYNAGVSVSAEALGGVASSQCRRVTVTVSSGGESLALSGYRLNY